MSEVHYLKLLKIFEKSDVLITLDSNSRWCVIKFPIFTVYYTDNDNVEFNVHLANGPQISILQLNLLSYVQSNRSYSL